MFCRITGDPIQSDVRGVSTDNFPVLTYRCRLQVATPPPPPGFSVPAVTPEELQKCTELLSAA